MKNPSNPSQPREGEQDKRKPYEQGQEKRKPTEPNERDQEKKRAPK